MKYKTAMHIIQEQILPIYLTVIFGGLRFFLLVQCNLLRLIIQQYADIVSFISAFQPGGADAFRTALFRRR